MRYNVFISYRRDGGEYTAKILRDRLGDLGYNVFFDVEALRSGDFNTKLYSVIDECSDMLVILSPGALDRCQNDDDWVRREIEYALEKGKNIVPILLRGFTFPSTLPDSIEPLRYKNGIEANSEFFDAFIEKLQHFLSARVPLSKRLRPKRLLSLVTGLLVVAVLCFGGVQLWRSVSVPAETLYPSTRAEENFTGEVLYYTQNHVLVLDQIGGYMQTALQAASDYLAAGGDDYHAAKNALNNSRKMIEEVDETLYAPSDAFLARMGASPFETAEFVALHNIVASFKTECLDNIDFIAYAISDEFFFSNTYKLQVLSCYEIFAEETLRIYGLCTNQMLLPIENEDSLKSFKRDFLPLLTAVPLTATAWGTDYDALQSDIDKSSARMDTALDAYAMLVGTQAQKSSDMLAELIATYVELGYTEEEAEALARAIMDE